MGNDEPKAEGQAIQETADIHPDYFLALAWLHGNKSAGEELYKLSYKEVAGHVLAYIDVYARYNSYHEAYEEGMQDVYYAAFTSMDKYWGKSSFSTWLLGVARNLKNKRISKSNDKHVLLPYDEDILSEEFSDPYFGKYDIDMVLAVRAAMLKLKPKHRKILIERARYDIPYKKIAVRAQEKNGSLRKRYSDALTKLRKNFYEIYIKS